MALSDFLAKQGPKSGSWYGPRNTSEFRRIISLPRRQWTDGAEALAEELTAELKTPGGEMSLWPIQATALAELVLFGGIFAPIRVGRGNRIV